MWTQRWGQAKFRRRILDFWRWVHSEKFQGRDPQLEGDQITLCEIEKLSVYLPELDSENVEWLKASARYQRLDDFNYPYLVEYLDRLKDAGDPI